MLRKFSVSLVSMFKNNILISLFSQIKMKSWNFGNLMDSNNYFVTSPLSLVWVWSEFGINVQKQYTFTIFTLMIYQWGSDNRLVSSDFQQTCACLLKIRWILDSSDFQQICKNYFNGDPVITWSSKNMQKLWHCFWKSHLRHYRWVPVGIGGYR